MFLFTDIDRLGYMTSIFNAYYVQKSLNSVLALDSSHTNFPSTDTMKDISQPQEFIGNTIIDYVWAFYSLTRQCLNLIYYCFIWLLMLFFFLFILQTWMDKICDKPLSHEALFSTLRLSEDDRKIVQVLFHLILISPLSFHTHTQTNK